MWPYCGRGGGEQTPNSGHPSLAFEGRERSRRGGLVPSAEVLLLARRALLLYEMTPDAPTVGTAMSMEAPGDD